MNNSGWLRMFGSFRVLATVILVSAFLTSVAFTAASGDAPVEIPSYAAHAGIAVTYPAR